MDGHLVPPNLVGEEGKVEMRVVFVGASRLTVRTAHLLVERGHEVVIVEADREKIDALSEDMDCSFLHGDGSKPQILQEAGPEQTDVLYCLTDVDQDNIIAGLVGRSLGFPRVITSIQEPDFETICVELGLEETIIPSRTISRYLADAASGMDILELSTAIRGEARVFTFVAGQGEAGAIEELDVPERARVICYYRGGDFHMAEGGTSLKEGDEVVLLTSSENLAALRERFGGEDARKSS